LRTKDLKRVTVDTTVQPKAITFPTDVKLLHAGIKGLGRLARRYVVPLRQSYLRIAKRAAVMTGRYAHAKQFNRHHRQLRLLRTRLGRMIRDIRRKIAGNAELGALFEEPLGRASQIRSHQRGWKPTCRAHLIGQICRSHKVKIAKGTIFTDPRLATTPRHPLNG
jgi:IS5 family transposase